MLSAGLTQLRDYEKRSTIVAPIAGTVTHLAVAHPGSMIGTTEPAAVPITDDHVQWHAASSLRSLACCIDASAITYGEDSQLRAGCRALSGG